MKQIYFAFIGFALTLVASAGFPDRHNDKDITAPSILGVKIGMTLSEFFEVETIKKQRFLKERFSNKYEFEQPPPTISAEEAKAFYEANKKRLGDVVSLEPIQPDVSVMGLPLIAYWVDCERLEESDESIVCTITAKMKVPDGASVEKIIPEMLKVIRAQVGIPENKPMKWDRVGKDEISIKLHAESAWVSVSVHSQGQTLRVLAANRAFNERVRKSKASAPVTELK